MSSLWYMYAEELNMFVVSYGRIALIFDGSKQILVKASTNTLAAGFLHFHRRIIHVFLG